MQQVEAMMEDAAKPRRFTVTIKWAARVDVGAVIEFIEYCSPFCTCFFFLLDMLVLMGYDYIIHTTHLHLSKVASPTT